MREIKFRVWDGEKYIHFDNHQYDLVYNDICGWNIKPNVPNYSGEWTAGESQSKTPDFKMEQFTGLKDKNGKEIYEGDILPMKFDPPSKGGIEYGNEFTLNGVVEYDLPHQAKYKISFPDNKLGIISCEFGWGSMPDLEVIGNIYENPDLL